MAPAQLDEIRVIPAAIPPHREIPVAGIAERLNMIRIALTNEPGMMLDTRELERAGQSYTVDTVRELQAEIPNTRFSLILGLDAALGLDQWHGWKELLSLVSILLMARPGWSLPEPLPPWWDMCRESPAPDSPGKFHLIPIKPMDISSTQIRADLCANQDVRHSLHPGVHDYICHHKLYISSLGPELVL